MRFSNPSDESKELTYSDVFLYPQRTSVSSRFEVDLKPAGNTGLTIPIVAANMTAVAGRRMAETLARRGGVVVLPQDIALDRVEQMVSYVKKCHQVFETPVTLHPDESIQTALNLIYKRAHGAILVVDEGGKPVGIFTEADAKLEDRFSHLDQVMTRELITVQSGAGPEEIFKTLHERRLNIVPVVKSDGTLVGVMTRNGAIRATVYTPAVNQRQELLTSVAVGVNKDIEQVVGRLRDARVDIIVMDTAHGHQEKMVEAVKKARAILGPDKALVAGNVVTPEAVEDLVQAGASIVKVGVGPGAMCTTRMMTGMGRPQFSAVTACAARARQLGAAVWADGGVKYPRDVALALAAGAQAVMIGTWFAGTYESPADIKQDERGRLFKENFGMASRRAVTNRTKQKDPLDQARKQLFEEGRSESKMYLQPGQESVEDILDSITAGVRSACTYAGARNLMEFAERAVVGVQTQAGYTEGKAVSESW
jgi:IMP dehydrogenase